MRPGELSRTHGGVLLMDEFPLFRRDVIDALREPLENGEITIARAEELVTLPARTLLVLAANPCPCGEQQPTGRSLGCRCRAVALREYAARLGGPVADRIDITRHVQPLSGHERGDRFAPREGSAEVRARVEAARARQQERYAGAGWRLNGHAPGVVLRDEWPLTDAATAVLDASVVSGELTNRGAVRVHRMAWTVHDLDPGSSGPPDVRAVDVAMRLRRGLPLPVSCLARRAPTGESA